MKKLSTLYAPGLSPHISQEKLDKWCQIISQGDKKNFEKRFIWSGIDTFQSQPALNETALEIEEGTVLPTWPATLNECLKAITKPDATVNKQLLNPDFPLPFEEILLPFIYHARQKLKTEVAEDYHLISESAHTELERNLLRWLSYLNSYTMEFEFSVFRSLHQSRLSRIVKPKEDKVSSACYEKFLQHLQNGNLCHYFKEYAVLARLMATAVEQWIETVAELLSRFKKDKLRLQKTFNNGKLLGNIMHVQPSLSDRHNRGRTVMVVEFESGIRLVYKPKELGIEQAYNNLLELLNARGTPIQFKAYKVVNHKAYGWAEFVTSKPLESSAAAKKYYERAGALLCLVYVLGATDLHDENIIGHGDFPVLIDIETLLHPFVHDSIIADKNENADAKAKKLLIDSVIRTGLLPHWHLEDEGQAYDVSGLGSFMPQEYSLEGLKWRHINTDLMQVRREKISIYSREEPAGTPKLEAYKLNHFTEEIIQGFRQLYHFLVQNRDFISGTSCWQALANQAIRFVFRPTKVYAQLEQNLLHPALLKNGIDRSMHLDILYRNMTSEDAPPLWWPLIQAEQDAMEIMDTPHFSARAGSDAMELPGGKEIKNYFTEPSFHTATNRLKGLNEQDLKQQEAFIRGALVCRSAEENHTTTAKEKAVSNKSYNPLTKEMALKQAITIANILKEKAIIAQDSSITWIAPKYYPNVKRYQLESISASLYDGSTGIALFFAALFSLTGQQEYKEFALRALKVPCEHIKATDATMRVVGGFTGYGSLIYSFLKVGILTGESNLVQTARKAATLVTKSAIDQDKIHDVMHGSAGSILSLLELYDYNKDKGLLDLSVYAGNHLLRSRSLTTSGFNVWESDDETFLTGYSHGAAGIAYALLRLYKLTDNLSYKAAALEAIAYERSVFDKTENNWPDFRKSKAKEEVANEDKRFMCSWCHGATGIGLARLAALDILDTEDTRKEIRLAVEATKGYVTSGMDHICCGNFGRLELLLSASMKFNDELLLKFALDKAGAIIKLPEINNDYHYNPHIGFTPGFFQGISGIGYQILRLAYPNVLPSVLTLN